MSLFIEQQPAKLILSGQPAIFRVVTDYTDPCRIMGGVTGDAGDSLVPNADLKVQFNLADYLKGRVVERGSLGNAPLIYTNSIKSLTFTFSELYGDPPTSHNSLVSNTFYVMDGKVPERWRKVIYPAYGSLLQFLYVSKNCLTWWTPAHQKKVLINQKEFLNFLQVSSLTPLELKMHVNLILTDGTVVSGPNQSAVQNVAMYKMVFFPTGYAQLGIDAFMAANHPGKEVDSYSVLIRATGVSLPVSSTYTYKIDRAYHESTRQLWLRNSFGMWEVLLCTGYTTAVTDNKPEAAQTDGISMPADVVWKNTKSEAVKVNTGYFPSTQAGWIADLLDTIEAYELMDGVLQPITLKDSKIITRHDGDYQYSADIEYEYGYAEPIETD